MLREKNIFVRKYNDNKLTHPPPEGEETTLTLCGCNAFSKCNTVQN